MAEEEKQEKVEEQNLTDQTQEAQSDEDLMKLWEEAMQAQAQAEPKKQEEKESTPEIPEDFSKELERILDIPLSITVVIGTTTLTIKELLALRPGSVVALDESINSFVSVYANGRLIAKAELVVVGENFGIRIAEIIEKEERVKTLAG